MALQISYSDELRWSIHSEAYCKIESLNVVDVSEIFKTVVDWEWFQTINEPKGSVSWNLCIYSDMSANREEKSPIASLRFSIGNWLLRSDPIIKGGVIVWYWPLEYKELTNEDWSAYLLWDNVFIGATSVDLSDRSSFKSDVAYYIYMYIKTLDNFCGINLTSSTDV